MTANVARLDVHRIRKLPRPIRPRAGSKLKAHHVAALRDLGRYLILNTKLFEQSSGYRSTISANALDGLFERDLADRGWYHEPRTAEEIAMASQPKANGLAYKLTRAGLKRGIAEGVIEEDALIAGGKWSGVAPRDMVHRILLVELMIKLRLELSAHDRLVLGRLTPDFVRKGNRGVNRDDVSDKRFLVPDLIAGIETKMGGFPALWYFEVEQKRLQPFSRCKTRATVATKLRPYSDYFVSPLRTIKGADQDVLLYVQNQSPDHLEEIIQNVPWDDVGNVRKVVRFSTFDEIRKHGILHGRWRNHAGEIVRLVS